MSVAGESAPSEIQARHFRPHAAAVACGRWLGVREPRHVRPYSPAKARGRAVQRLPRIWSDREPGALWRMQRKGTCPQSRSPGRTGGRSCRWGARCVGRQAAWACRPCTSARFGYDAMLHLQRLWIRSPAEPVPQMQRFRKSCQMTARINLPPGVSLPTPLGVFRSHPWGFLLDTPGDFLLIPLGVSS